MIETVLELLTYESQIHERGYRNHPLTEQQQESNREKSQIRAQVEHVFGSWVMELGVSWCGVSVSNGLRRGLG
nr:transposase [Neosynechococcus sphagnicola]